MQHTYLFMLFASAHHLIRYFHRLHSIVARHRYDPFRPINDEKYDPNYKNMKKSFWDKHFECKGEEFNRELTEKQMHKILPSLYPWMR